MLWSICIRMLIGRNKTLRLQHIMTRGVARQNTLKYHRYVFYASLAENSPSQRPSDYVGPLCISSWSLNTVITFPHSPYLSQNWFPRAFGTRDSFKVSHRNSRLRQFWVLICLQAQWMQSIRSSPTLEISWLQCPGRMASKWLQDSLEIKLLYKLFLQDSRIKMSGMTLLMHF